MIKGTIDFKEVLENLRPFGNNVGSQTIAQFFACEIQYGPSLVDYWKDEFSRILNGDQKSGFQGTGNAYNIYATDNLILLFSEYSDKSVVCLDVEQMFSALENYRSFLANGYRVNDGKPNSFEVEFLAEGEQAIPYYQENGGDTGGI